MTLILASGSRYRRELLARLGLPFDSIAPAIDETGQPGETARELAGRLAREKARAIRDDDAIVIGSDQAPSLAGRILRKPGDRQTAIEQLLACQGATVDFHTAVCIRDTRTGIEHEHIDTTCVAFASLPVASLERYVDAEEPFDSAGGFKAEGLGIALFRHIRSEDPTALIGLPLIKVAELLRLVGLDPLAPV